ncbi:MAG: peroxiredoxin [Gammaproteobacteria bacterium]|nr:peroxiredoxin [Gammaproteobacteria bacterium]
MSIVIGDPLPDLVVAATGGKEVNLATLAGKPLVIYFYPKDSTPGCTTEGQDFRDLLPQFAALECTIFGVSRDSLKSHENFKEKQCFPFDLLSDSDEQLCQAFDVIKEKKNYGRTYMGIERSTFLFNRDGKLSQAWRKVSVKGHAEAVLAALADL